MTSCFVLTLYAAGRMFQIMFKFYKNKPQTLGSHSRTRELRIGGGADA